MSSLDHMRRDRRNNLLSLPINIFKQPQSIDRMVYTNNQRPIINTYQESDRSPFQWDSSCKQSRSRAGESPQGKRGTPGRQDQRIVPSHRAGSLQIHSRNKSRGRIHGIRCRSRCLRRERAQQCFLVEKEKQPLCRSLLERQCWEWLCWKRGLLGMLCCLLALLCQLELQHWQHCQDLQHQQDLQHLQYWQQYCQDLQHCQDQQHWQDLLDLLDWLDWLDWLVVSDWSEWWDWQGLWHLCQLKYCLAGLCFDWVKVLVQQPLYHSLWVQQYQWQVEWYWLRQAEYYQWSAEYCWLYLAVQDQCHQVVLHQCLVGLHWLQGQWYLYCQAALCWSVVSYSCCQWLFLYSPY